MQKCPLDNAQVLLTPQVLFIHELYASARAMRSHSVVYEYQCKCMSSATADAQLLVANFQVNNLVSIRNLKTTILWFYHGDLRANDFIKYIIKKEFYYIRTIS